jgi:hypothetical protein
MEKIMMNTEQLFLILTALSADPKALKNLKFLHHTADGLFNSVAVSGGKVYLAGDTNGWNETGLSQFEGLFVFEEPLTTFNID